MPKSKRKRKQAKKSKPPRLVLDLSGGIVQAVYSNLDMPVDIAVVDWDVDSDEDDHTYVTTADGLSDEQAGYDYHAWVYEPTVLEAVPRADRDYDALAMAEAFYDELYSRRVSPEQVLAQREAEQSESRREKLGRALASLGLSVVEARKLLANMNEK